MIRYTLQAELYGLTQNQINQGINFVNNAITNESVNVSGPVAVRQQTVRGDVELLVEVNDFTTRSSGDRIFNSCVGWASSRAEDAASGAHSYVWLKEVDDQAGTIKTRRADSPGWVEQNTTEPLRIAR